jgi:hypothetical protein
MINQKMQKMKYKRFKFRIVDEKVNEVLAPDLVDHTTTYGRK